MNSIAQQVEKEQHFSERIKKFFREYEIGKALHSCNAHKKKGFSVVEIIMYLLKLRIPKSRCTPVIWQQTKHKSQLRGQRIPEILKKQVNLLLWEL